MTNISLETLTGTFNDTELITPNLVDSTDAGVPILSFLFSADEPPPEDGVIINVNSDIEIANFFADVAAAPRGFGGEIINAIYNDEGIATGFQFRLDSRNAVTNFIDPERSRRVDIDDNQESPQDITFFLEPGEDYTIDNQANSSQFTVYSTLEQLPLPPEPPEVSLSVSESFLNESEGTETSLLFDVEGEIPPEGVIVYVSSGVVAGVGEFDIFNAEIEGGAFPSPDEIASGFYFKITEPKAQIDLQVFPDQVVEGQEILTFELQDVPGYSINPDASSVELIIQDNDDSLLQVGLVGEPEVLIESEKTVSIHTFNLSRPAVEGLSITVNSPNLNDFNLDEIVVENGQVSNVTANSFDLFVEPDIQVATIELPILNDGEEEGLETATFILEPQDPDFIGFTDSYQLDPEATAASFTLVDIPEQAPGASSETESNDTINTANSLNLNAENPNVSVDGAISFNFGQNRDVDETEDVDIYSFSLEAGDKVNINLNGVEASPLGLAELRLFDESGNQVAVGGSENSDSDDIFPTSLPEIEYTATETATYYVGVSLFLNDFYDPLVKPSGSGVAFPDLGFDVGDYTLNLTLNDASTPSQPDEFIFPDVETPPPTSDPSVEVESNDTLDTAIDAVASVAKPIAVDLTADFPEITIAGDINYDFFTNPVLIDASEDVDFYAFDLDASQTLLIDVDASGLGGTGIGSPLDSILRLFDAEGNELEIVGNAPAPNEVFLAFGDPYLEFTAPEAGTYYAGISNLGNDDYDPFVVGSGSGWVFPDFGFDVGPYEVTFTLEDNQVDIIGTDDNETLDGNDADNLVAGLLGDDTLFGNGGDDVLRGDANNRSPGGVVGGDDVISGGDGNDQIGGKAGNDLLSGDAGDDEIFGDDGDDTIMGAGGDDTLTGDDFSGGSGSDLFVFGNGDGTDIITDFDVTEDLIGLVEGELTFEDIEVIEIDGNAAINVMETEETLAVLNGVEPDELTAELFIVTPDISFG